MVEKNEREIKKDLLGELGRKIEARVLIGEELMKPDEVSMLRDVFVENRIKLDNVKEKGDLNKQANRVLEAFGDVDKMAETVGKCVLAVSKLEGGEVTNGDVQVYMFTNSLMNL